jgi:hypothetical protein
MAETSASVSPFMGYEHRDKDGKVISIGKNRILRHGKFEFTQETDKGAKIYQSLQVISDGRMLEEKFYTDGKETEKLTFAYDEKGELLSVTDKAGAISLSPLGEEKMAIK